MGKGRSREKKSKKHKNKHKKSKSKHKKHGVESAKKVKTNNLAKKVINDESGFEIPIELMNTKSHTPVTPEEYHQRQNQMRRVVDSSTGRVRLIRGDGEVMEEIVTKEQHTKINNLATKTDGEIFQKNTVGIIKKAN
ncbi:ADP-ribosylation factor-like protein 6-interacting protein 4 [Eurosta solidaginis]|uniref:ADP-ribosylation factor-like protein 6-interacting protein 4 n=1 Tax=Eurosta solidaginis TaxID=178769 RepID=UPI003530866C